MNRKTITLAAVFALAAPAGASATMNAPVRSSATQMTATGTAPAAGEYRLESTILKLGVDPWWTRQSQVLAAGQPYVFRMTCVITIGTHGWRVVGPTASSPASWTKCR